MTQKTLDKLLEAWATRHAIGEAHRRELADRIAEELPRHRLAALDESVARRARPPLGTRLAYAALGGAAALAIALGVALLSPPRPADSGDAVASELASIPHSELEARARLFCEVERLFADELRWVADTDEAVRVDVRPAVGGPAPDAVPLLIRVVVVERKPGGTWRKLLRADILTRSEELVQAAPDPTGDHRLVLWAYPLPDGNIAVDTSLRLNSLVRAGVDATNVVAPGEPIELLSLKVPEAEYRVFQVVKALPRHTEGASCSGI